MVLWFNKKISDQLENMKKFSFISSSKKIYATTISRALIVINGKDMEDIQVSYTMRNLHLPPHLHIQLHKYIP